MTAPETIPPRDEPPENGPETVAHAQAPETAAPTRDYLETPGPSGATAEAKSGESGLRHAPRIPGYEILEELGRGGMGVVYKARQLGLKRLVALKMIRAHSCDSRALSRFRAEAAAAARLQHPNIVQVYEIGEQHEEPYFALEFVSGGALAQRLDRTPQPARASAALVETIARAVQAAHEKGIVHRDLKPANILLDQGSSEPQRTVSGSPAATAHPATNPGHSGSNAGSSSGSQGGSQSGSLRANDATAPGVWGRAVPKIADFGIAKTLSSEGDEHEPAALRTETGAILGTPSYMAPEQAAGRSDLVGPTTDVYALGAILYELLTGKTPFLGPTAIETVHMVLTKEPVAPRKFVPRTPRDLETICLKCLEKTRERRYQSALELADDLRRFLDGEPILARPTSLVERIAKWSRKRPGLVATIVAGTLAACAALAAGVWAWDAYYRTKIEYYHSLIMLTGRPTGAGRLTPEQAARRSLSYRFTRRGGQVESVQLVDGQGFPTPASEFFNLATILGGDDGEDREASYEFRSNDAGHLQGTTAYSATGDVLWRFHFTTPEMGHYTDARGFPKARSASGATYVQFVADAQGVFRKLRYLDRNGVPRCSAQKIYGAELTFDDRGRVTAVAYLGPNDQPTQHKQGMSRVVCRYDDRDRLTELQALGLDGRPAMLNLGFSAARVSYDDHGNLTLLEYFGPDGRVRGHVDGYERVAFTYDAQGRLARQAYQDAQGRPVLSAAGYAIEERRYDQRGRLSETAYLGVDGRPTLNRYGVARLRFNYDEAGRKLEELFVGLDGRPTLAASGSAGVRYRYDAEGRVVDETTLGLDGRPTPSARGYATVRRDYDAAGHVVRASYLDAEGKAVRHADGEQQATYKYDEYGNQIEQAYRDAEGRLVMTRIGFARVTQRFDEEGNVVEWFKWDEQGGPARDDDGAHKVLAEYDGRRNQIAYRAFGPDLKPVVTTSGYASWRAEHDPFGNIVRQAYFDPAGKPTLYEAGYASYEADYNALNACTEMRYFGLDGRLRSDGGVAKTVYELDEVGRRLAEAHFDAAGRPTTDEGGCHRVTFAYDSRGLEIERRYFGADGLPTTYSAFGNAIWRRTYDALGRAIEEAHFDERERPTDNRDGYALMRSTYDAWGRATEIHYLSVADGGPPSPSRTVRQAFDAQGNLTEWAVFSPAGEPTTWGEAAHRREHRYDGANRRIETRQFGVDGRPLAAPEAAVMRFENDDFGRAKVTSLFDAEGRPVESAAGVHREESDFDLAGRVVERRYFDAEGKPAAYGNVGNAIWRKKYDALGRLIEESYFDAAGRRCAVKGCSYAIVRYVRDSHGNAIETRHYDVDDKPTGDQDGCFAIFKTYDARGFWTSRNAVDLNSQPVALDENIYRQERRLDSRGNALSTAYFDAQGEPMRNSAGVHREERDFDADGREIARRYFSIDGTPARHAALGNSQWRRKYDPKGWIIEESYHGPDGALMNLPSGDYAIVRYGRDEQGNQIETRYYDDQDQPTGGSDGLFAIHARFDSRGNIVSIWGYDAQMQPKLISGGVYRKDRVIDDRGNVASTAYFDAEGRPMPNPQGVHREESDFDDANREIERRYIATDGKPAKYGTVGNSIWRKKYDAQGQVIEESYHDGDGRLMNLEGVGYAIARYERDEWGNAAVSRYYDANDQPTNGSDGVFELYGKYDSQRRCLSEWAFDAAGKPALLSDGVHRKDRVYDAAGNVLRVSYFDGDGKPTRCVRGAHVEEADYDERGRIVDTRWFDEAGRPLPLETVVQEVTPGGIGEQIGLRPGDAYVSYDGEPITNRDRLVTRRRRERPSEPARRLVWRRGEEILSADVRPGLLGVMLETRVARSAEEKPKAETPGSEKPPASQDAPATESTSKP